LTAVIYFIDSSAHRWTCRL